MRTPSTDRDAAITSWPPARSYCGQSTGADAQGGAASGLPAIHPAAASCNSINARDGNRPRNLSPTAHP